MDEQEVERFFQRLKWFGKEPEFPLEPSPMYERFTDRARKVMQLADQECVRLNHEYVGTEHILIGLIKEGSGVAANVLKNMDMNLEKLRQEVMNIVQAGPDVVVVGNKRPITPRGKQVLEWAMTEARELQHNYVGTEHLLLGLLHVTEGVACQVMENLGVSLAEVKEEIMNLLGHSKESEQVMKEVFGVWKTNVPVTDTDRHKLAEIERIVSFTEDPAEAVAAIKKVFGK